MPHCDFQMVGFALY